MRVLPALLIVLVTTTGCDYFKPGPSAAPPAASPVTAAATTAAPPSAAPAAQPQPPAAPPAPSTTEPARARETPVAQATRPGTGGGAASSATTRLNAEMHLNQGMTYSAMKDWDNAIAEFTKATDVDRRYAAAYANRAVAYMQQRKYNKALDDLKQAESLSPDDRLVHYNYVALYSLQNQLDRALDSLDRALDLGFNNYDALRNDPDLNNVRAHPQYQRVLEKHKVFLR